MKNLSKVLLLTLFMSFAFAIQAEECVPRDSVELDTANVVSEVVKQDASSLVEKYVNEAENSVDVLEIVGCVTPFIFVLILVALLIYSKIKRTRMRNELVIKALDKGVVLPDYVFADGKKRKKTDALSTALIVMAVGVAVPLFFVWNEDYAVAILTSMVFLIGLAKLIVYLVNRKEKKQNDENDDTDVE